jgi:hypothetical protein
MGGAMSFRADRPSRAGSTVAMPFMARVPILDLAITAGLDRTGAGGAS